MRHHRSFPRTLFLLCVLLSLPGFLPLFGLELAETRAKPDDLAISGDFAAVPSGATRYLRHDELLALPEVQTITEEPSQGMGQHECTVLFMADFFKYLPLKQGADCLLLRCADKWESIYKESFVKVWNPYILLRMDGKALDGITLPPPYDKEKLAPYYMNVSLSKFPGFKNTDYNNVDPTQVVEIVAATYDSYLKPWFTGPYAKLSPAAADGRTIFLNNCASCHQGPGGAVGGHVSTRPWEVLTVHATYNQKYFIDYVRNPQKYIPGVVMPTHESFTADTFDKLIAFLSAGSAPAASN